MVPVSSSLATGYWPLTTGHWPLTTDLGYDPYWTKQVLDGFKIRTQPDRWPAGKFIHPHDACFDKNGNIFVTEWVAMGQVSFLRHVS
ncbi:MAG: hypothetical protein ABSH35_04400 [Isosphaeraceae bacterium]